MSPVIAYASKVATFAAISAGLFGEGIAKMAVIGVTMDSVFTGVAGGVGLLLIGLRLWRDERLYERMQEVAEERRRIEYARGVKDGQGGKTVSEALDEIPSFD